MWLARPENQASDTENHMVHLRKSRKRRLEFILAVQMNVLRSYSALPLTKEAIVP